MLGRRADTLPDDSGCCAEIARAIFGIELALSVQGGVDIPVDDPEPLCSTPVHYRPAVVEAEPPKREYLYRGLVRCGVCGLRMLGNHRRRSSSTAASRPHQRSGRTSRRTTHRASTSASPCCTRPSWASCPRRCSALSVRATGV